jgi:trehalose 6-phosphate phosphatase
MRSLLARVNEDVLRSVAATRSLVVFDYDGTLAPIVSSRDDAWMRTETEALLRLVCRRYPCAIISGRARADVVARLGGAEPKYVVGNHGIEPSPGFAAFTGIVAEALSVLARRLGGEPDLDLENKTYSLAVHYRRSRSPERAIRRILTAVEDLPTQMRVVHGKRVVNLAPKDAPTKGDALEHLFEAERAHLSLFVGDDVTDEDAFQLRPSSRHLAVRVGHLRASAAGYFLRDQTEMDRLLTVLAALRPAGEAT